ncbi:MAG: preQ(1) synthase [Acidobacteriia bacterium]|nr:preQ(1) synthase [Terriglobia bacterium]
MGYTKEHAKSGIDTKLPKIDVWPNQFPRYEITIVNTEYTSVCPKTGLPDFGTITIHYLPNQHCVELKSLRQYFLAYRNLGIFYENAVNKILKDFVAACRPRWARVKGEFTSRGGMHSIVEARFPRH